MAEELKIVGEHRLITIEKRPIYRGAFSKVFFGTYQNKEVAVKRVERNDALAEELEMLQNFQHENIVRYLFTDKHPVENFIFIVLEKCQFTLEKFIEEKKTGIPYPKLLRQIVRGLDYLHSVKNILHRDLKPSNILMLFLDGKWVVKIADFGISKSLPVHQTRIPQSSVKGTTGYMAPEQLVDGGKIGKHMDIFCLGLIFHFVLSDGKHPFGDKLDVAERNIRDEKAKPNLEHLSENYRNEVEDLILCMIEKDYKKRITIREVKASHVFWNAEKKIGFLQNVSDFFKSKNQDSLQEMQKLRKKVTSGRPWKDLICGDSFNLEVKKTIEKKTGWKGRSSLHDLLKLIRNWSHHYFDGQTTPELKKELGAYPDGFAHFFTTHIPKLLPCVYQFMHRLKDEELFKKYYGNIKTPRNLAVTEASEASGTHLQENQSDTSASTSEDMDVQENSSQGEKDEARTALAIDIPSASPNAQPITRDAEPNTSSVEEAQASTSRAIQRTGLTHGMEDMDVDGKKIESKLVLRSYQKELAEQALRGENSLIVAPTGSGKTAVLTEVINQHLKKLKGNGHVMFMAPKVVLASQQYQYLQRHLGKRSIAYLIGQQLTESGPVGQKILDNQVTVLTPQLLINELKRDKKATDLSFHDLSMLIFDECHSTIKNHPYRQLMDMVLDFQEDNQRKAIQVIGVTASPGVGKGIDKLAVRKNLIELLGNLNVMSAPSMVEKNLRELAEHCNKIKEYFIKIQPETEFGREVESVIKEIESIVFTLLEGYHATLRTAPRGKASQPYDSWIKDLKETARTHVSDGEICRLLLSYADNLKLYHWLLQLKDLVPNAMKLATIMAGYENGTFSTNGPERIELEEKYKGLQQKAHTIQIPMFDRLLGILREEFIGNPEARCIVFVKWKLTAKYLCDNISKKVNGIESVYMTGTQASGGAKGMAKSEQHKVAEDFREGKYKILVATSVAEEGLDIGKCSLVIMYNDVTGEVGRLQRLGRARTKNSRGLLLTVAHSDHKKREDDNKSRAEATWKAIEEIKKSNATALQSEIRRAQEAHRDDLKIKASISNNRDYEPPAKYQILCANCEYFLTTADKLRDLEETHTVVSDEEFFLRTEKKSVQKHKSSDVKGSADYLCKGNHCGKKVALEIDRGDKHYPVLSMKKVLVKKDNERPRGPMKRKNLPFQIVTSVKKAGDESISDGDGKFSPDESTEASLDEYDCIEFLEMENESDCDDLSL